MTKKIFKQVIKTAIVIAVIGAIIVAFRVMGSSKSGVTGMSSQVQEKEIKNSQLTQLQGSGLQKVAENDHLSLSVDFRDGNIEVLNKQNGYVWRSKPTAEELRKDKSNKLWKDNLSSPIIFNYVNDFTSANTMVGNVNNQNTKISVYQLDGGVRVYDDFTKSKVKIAYDLVLQDDHLNISIPSYLIDEPGAKYIKNTVGSKKVDRGKTVLITDISLFPSLGATRNNPDEKGYLFLPDGPGALIRFDSSKGLNSQFVGTVYGEDLSYLNKYDSTLRNAMQGSKILYPVFGIVKEQNALTGIIDQGDSNADIIGSPAGVQTGFNTAYVRYNYRSKYKVITSPSDGNGYFRYTDSGTKLKRSVQYYFNSGDDANYIGMAKNYRNYLIETKGIKQQDNSGNETPLQLNIYGGTMKQNFIGRSFVSMTTFQQAEGMVDFFKDNNVKNMDITYKGWGSKGDPVGQPYRFPAASKLGGNSGLTKFVDYAHESGYKVYLEDDHATAAGRKGISLGKNTVTNILGNPLDFGGSKSNAYFLNMNTMRSFMDHNIPQYKKYGIDGFEETGIGRFLNTDFNKNHPVSRDDVKSYYTDILNEARNNFSELRLSNAMAYELSNRTTFVDMPMDGSYLTVLDETVPFYEIALHGLVNYVFSNYNQFSEPDKQLLKAVEFGGNVSFTVTSEPAERLMEVKGNRLFSTEFSIWKDTILKQYRRVSSVLNEVQGQAITGYQKVSPDISVVTYEKGTKVVCNYSDQPYTYEKRTVNPMDFILIEGQ